MWPHTRTPLSETGVTATVPGELKGASTCLPSRSSHGDHLIKSQGTGGCLGAGRCLQGTSEQVPFAMVWHLRNPVATGEVGSLLGSVPAFSTPASDEGTRGRRFLRHSRPVYSKAFQKSRTAAEGASVSSGVAPWIPAQAGMTARGAGMMGRERGMTAWGSGPLIQNWGSGNSGKPPLPQSRPFEKPCCDRGVRTCVDPFRGFPAFP